MKLQKCDFIPSIRDAYKCKTCGYPFKHHREPPLKQPKKPQTPRRHAGYIFTQDECLAIAERCIGNRGQPKIEAEQYGVHRNTIHNIIFRYRAAQSQAA